MLHRQIEISDNENIRLQQEVHQLAVKLSEGAQSPVSAFRPVASSEYIPDIRHEERQEGEVGDNFIFLKHLTNDTTLLPRYCFQKL